ncbi:MAG: hypothetical protein R3E96_04160 [Planctomycetota bacterium]
MDACGEKQPGVSAAGSRARWRRVGAGDDHLLHAGLAGVLQHRLPVAIELAPIQVRVRVDQLHQRQFSWIMFARNSAMRRLVSRRRVSSNGAGVFGRQQVAQGLRGHAAQVVVAARSDQTRFEGALAHEFVGELAQALRRTRAGVRHDQQVLGHVGEHRDGGNALDPARVHPAFDQELVIGHVLAEALVALEVRPTDLHVAVRRSLCEHQGSLRPVPDVDFVPLHEICEQIFRFLGSVLSAQPEQRAAHEVGLLLRGRVRLQGGEADFGPLRAQAPVNLALFEDLAVEVVRGQRGVDRAEGLHELADQLARLVADGGIERDAVGVPGPLVFAGGGARRFLAGGLRVRFVRLPTAGKGQGEQQRRGGEEAGRGRGSGRRGAHGLGRGPVARSRG